MPIHAPRHEAKQPAATALPAPPAAAQRSRSTAAPAWERGLGATPLMELPFPLQTKLTVNTPGDEFEQQADRVADSVMRMPAPRLQRATCACGGEAGQDGECAACKAKRLALQRRATTAGASHVAPPIVHDVLRSPGKPLDSATRAFMEPRFGTDFGDVRVHNDPQAAESARAVSAQAYTVGSHVVFGPSRYAPATDEGRRLLAHELTHVRQQSTGQAGRVVQRQPNQDDWSAFESTFAGEPRFVFWAKRHNKKPPATYGEETALWNAFIKIDTTKEVREEYDRAQLEATRRELGKRRQAARAAEDRAAEAKPALRQMQRDRARRQNRTLLYTAIRQAWSDRRRYTDAELIDQVKSLVAHRIPLPKALRHGLHWKSDRQRWVFIYYYYREDIRVHPDWFDNPSADETELLPYAVLAEEEYLETSSKEADAIELDQYRKGIPRAARTEQIKKLAATRPMNPLKNFEPGIHDYAPYAGQPQSINVDVVGGDFDSDNITLSYSDGRELEIPLQGGLVFHSKPLDLTTVLSLFTRRHIKSGRLIPFVIYKNSPGINVDLLSLSEEDLALLGEPRFDPELTPIVTEILSPEFKLRKLSAASLKIASLHIAGSGLRQLVPLAAGALVTGSGLLTAGARLGAAAANEVKLAVTISGYSGATVRYLGGRAVTYYLMNALEINTASLIATDLVFNLAGENTGLLISPGDEVSMVVAEVKTGAKTAKNSWRVIEADVKEVELAGKQATLRLDKIRYRYIAEETAKAEYDLGKKLALIHRPASTGSAKAAQGLEEEAIKVGKLAAYTFEHSGHTWQVLKDGRIFRCSKWCTPASVEEAFGEMIKRYPHLAGEMTKLKKLKGKAAAEAATDLGNRLDQIRNGERMALDDLEKLLNKPEYTKGTPMGNDLRFVLYQKKGGKLGFAEWERMEMKLNLPRPNVSERDAGTVLQNHFPSSDWEYHPLYLKGTPANRIRGRNPLGSSEPEWYSKALNAAVEVKTKDFVARLDSVNWKAITSQLEQRIWAMPPGTKNWILFDIRRQPVSIAEVTIFPKLSSKWDEVFFLTDNGMLKIVGNKAVPFP